MARRPPRRPPAAGRPELDPRGASDALMAFAGVSAWQPKAPPAGTTVEYMNLLALAEAAARDNDATLALGYLKRAAKAVPDKAQPHVYAARVQLGAGRPVQAARALHEAIRLEPDHAEAKARFARLVADLPVAEHRWIEPKVVADCLEADGIGHQDLVDVGQRLLAKGAMAALLGKGASEGWDAAALDLLGGAARGLLGDRLLIGTLRRGLNVHVPFERLFTAVRRQIVLERDGPPDAPWLGFVGALAEQCFLNEYLWFAETDEEARVAELATSVPARLERGMDEALEADLLRVALYRALADVPGTEALLRVDRRSPPLGRVVEITLAEPRAERAAEAAIRTIAQPRDRVSKQVKAQYEASPYPRWLGVNLPDPGAGLRELKRLAGETTVRRFMPKPRVLVAGCGTGMHAMPCALKYGKEASVLAIDLSRPSLAYAQRRAAALGLGNIDFAEADILELGDMVGPFDIIECGGVLHHMADPMAGWRVLARLLVPGGVMKIGLYSERARRPMAEAIADARAHGDQPTPAGIRAFRHRLFQTTPGAWALALARFRDFFSTSQCRDMLFHVQEHRFSPARLAACLNELGLAFRGFQVADAVRAAYRAVNPDDPGALDLARWEAFEADNPDTFVTMFQFWCQKPL